MRLDEALGRAARPAARRAGLRARLQAWVQGRWRIEVGRLSPRRRGLLDWSLGHPEAVVVPAAAIIAGAFGLAYGDGDAAAFRHAGEAMLGPGFLSTFENSWLQIGPLYLFVLGLLGRLVESWAGELPTTVLLASLQGGAVVWLAMGTTRRLARHRGMPTVLARWVVGSALAVGGAVSLSLEWGHPEEPLLGLLLIEVALLGARGRHLWAGALLGVATGVKLWGATGVGALIVARRLRGVMAAGAAAAVVTTAIYLPFVLSGEFRMTQHVWGFGTSSVLAWTAAHTGWSEWATRAFEGLLVGVAGAAVARRPWSSPAVLALVVISVRLVLDPEPRPYFICPAVGVALVWSWTSPSRGARRRRLLITVLSPLPIQLRALLPPDQTWNVALALVLLATLYAVVAEVVHLRHSRHLELGSLTAAGAGGAATTTLAR